MIDQERRLPALLLSYALLLIIGGIFAHETQSLAAIIASVISGVAVIAGSWMLWQRKRYALKFNLMVVLGLTSFFIYRSLLLLKFYPPVFLTVVSLFLSVRIVQAISKQKKSKNA